ncbi:Bug family tripartite tricarboxylate transporter substrate binding protein [Cupriavidus consociatus]|uniref:Bug family tripartite tricarboxylate transporter substrate binding protein n=1 Tax=Cupriavidus consociatus TaxID=2821357 RepID=UPI001AE8DA95|nr:MULTISPECIES: tripartite tricarboxylate transporter substrate binding protein [unclassified Cupriavidus]MBP0623666.1 tripartite tricarboxylate transporter substrate binding protein [Cupriavidus sp. LEh25]MDK2660370.1 tripartite tricarboxylate transporter substrate binding protein [Cupriavidus sp. LEh21]
MFKQAFKVQIAAALLAAAQASYADAWPEPSKPINLIVPAPGGGGTGDTIARLLAQNLKRELNATVVVDNRGGANGNIGAGLAAAAKPNGYTFLLSWAGTLAVNPSLYRKLPFDPQSSFAPVSMVAEVPNVLVVNNTLPVNSLAEFIAFAKSRNGELNYGSSGNGSSMHLAGELFDRETGVNMTHVPYSAPGTATTNLLANDIQVMFQLVPGIIGQVKAHKVKALAIMATKRSPALPDVPTTAELGHPSLVSSTWFAVLAPKETPDPIIQRMNVAINRALSNPEVVKALTEIGAAPLGGEPAKLASTLAADLTKWRAVVKQANIRLQ